MGVLPAYICVPHMHGVQEGQKRLSDSLELELQTVNELSHGC